MLKSSSCKVQQTVSFYRLCPFLIKGNPFCIIRAKIATNIRLKMKGFKGIVADFATICDASLSRKKFILNILSVNAPS